MLSLIAAASAASSNSTASQVATVLNAIAPMIWAVVVIVALVVFRAPLATAIGHVSQVDVGSTKIILQQQADSAANTAKQAAALVRNARPATSTRMAIPDDRAKLAISQATSSATSDPSGSVLNAWRAVEGVAGAVPAARVSGVMSLGVPGVVNELTKDNHVESALVPVAESLESLRQTAARNPKAITPATATSFVAAAADLADVIAQAGASAAPALPGTAALPSTAGSNPGSV
jgi:hypothetical protein